MGAVGSGMVESAGGGGEMAGVIDGTDGTDGANGTNGANGTEEVEDIDELCDEVVVIRILAMVRPNAIDLVPVGGTIDDENVDIQILSLVGKLEYPFV